MTITSDLKRAYSVIRQSTAKGYFAKTTASAAIREARKMVIEGRVPKYGGESVWAGLGGNDGKPFEAYGESAMRWIENPAKKGLRLVGLAHEVAPANYAYLHNAVEHSGWFLDDFQSETVCGIVFQLPARNGKARYIVGYSDPWNADKYGNGPACVSLNIIEGERKDSDYEADSGLRDAARYADGIAESMAEQEREYQNAWHAGRDAREKASEAKEAASDWIAEIRALRDLLKNRRALSPETIKNQIKAVKSACGKFRDTLEESRVIRAENMPTGDLKNAFIEGYESAA